MKKSAPSQSGFTLVEIAIVILITGLIVGATFSFLSVKQEQNGQQVTITRQQKIASALAYYAQVHNALPCPSSRRIQAGMTLPGDPIANCRISEQTQYGVVPFRVLGLSQEDVTDAWGNAINYFVSRNATDPQTDSVHYSCRNDEWINSGKVGKATFCCQWNDQTLNVIAVQAGSPNTVTKVYPDPPNPPVTTPAPKQGAPNYGNASVKAATGLTEPAPVYYAYVLVSHGKDGLGGKPFCSNHLDPNCNDVIDTNKNPPFNNINQGGNAMTGPAPTKHNFVVGPRVTSHELNGPGADDYFDDIVLWRTQNDVMREFNNDSCAKP